MTTTKVYKTMIGARMAIMLGRIKRFFKGSHYVAETYTLKFEKADKSYIVEHYAMTHDEERRFHEALKIKQQEITKKAQEILETKPQDNSANVEAPKMDKQKVAKIKLSDKNNSAQTEVPKMNAKPKQTAKPKTQNQNTTNTASDKPKKKYYHNGNKKKPTAKSNEAQQ
jgi:hypothetical protein